MAVEDFKNWFTGYLNARNLRAVFVGSQSSLGPDETHDINPATGNWSDPSSSSNKPPRWLYHLSPVEDGLQAHPLAEGSQIIAYANMRSADRAAIVVRLLPLIGTPEAGFKYEDDFEILALFVFSGGAPEGTSSQTFAFDPNTGILTYKGQPLQYVVGNLLGIQPRDKLFEVEIGASSHNYSYGQMSDVLASSISILTPSGTKRAIGTVDLTDDRDFEDLKTF